MTPEFFKARRLALGLTAAECADILDVDPRTIRRWEATGASSRPINCGAGHGMDGRRIPTPAIPAKGRHDMTKTTLDDLTPDMRHVLAGKGTRAEFDKMGFALFDLGLVSFDPLAASGDDKLAFRLTEAGRALAIEARGVQGGEDRTEGA